MESKAYLFWNRVDSLNKGETLLDMCRRVGLDYNRVKHNRSDCRVPKSEDLILLAEGLNSSIDFLLTGKNQPMYPERIRIIADACLNDATEEDLVLVERILRVSPGHEEKKAATSSGTIA